MQTWNIDADSKLYLHIQFTIICITGNIAISILRGELNVTWASRFAQRLAIAQNVGDFSVFMSYHQEFIDKSDLFAKSVGTSVYQYNSQCIDPATAQYMTFQYEKFL